MKAPVINFNNLGQTSIALIYVLLIMKHWNFLGIFIYFFFTIHPLLGF